MGIPQLRSKHKAFNAGSHNDCFALSLPETTSPEPMQIGISKEMIENCRHNDRKAQHSVYKQLFSNSLKICKRYSNSPDEAAEVLNSGFLKVFTQIDQYNGKGSFEGWVSRIMVNTSLDHLRNEKKYHEHFIFPENLGEIPAEESSDFQVQEEISLDVLYQMIHELPPASRMVFNLFVFEDFSHEEISKELGISIGTSKWHLSSARKSLQEKITKVYQEFQ
ncbi:MAG: sigma-70 family RNA polymerase sigma factor [Bacteroidota bacterium]